MKRIISITIAVCILFSTCVSLTVAATVTVAENSYEKQIFEIMSNYDTNPEQAILELESIDTVLVGKPVTIEHKHASKTKATQPTDYSLTVYCTKRISSTIYHLQWLLKANKTESKPGPIDFVGLEWDTKYASYYLSSGDGTYSTVAGRSTGLVMFNLQDSDLKAGKSSYGTVEVNKIKSGTMEYGVKFSHNFKKYLISGSATYSVSPSASVSASGDFSLGLSNTKSFTVSVSSALDYWNLWNDNAVNIP
jgi:hypothetical protein